MLIGIAVMSLCGVGIVFYVQFLIALSRENGSRWVGYWIRLRIHSGDNVVTNLQDTIETARRVA